MLRLIAAAAGACLRWRRRWLKSTTTITITAITRGRLLLTPMVMTSVRLERPMTCAGWTP